MAEFPRAGRRVWHRQLMYISELALFRRKTWTKGSIARSVTSGHDKTSWLLFSRKDKGPWEIRKSLIKTYKLKGLIWQLYQRDDRGMEWENLPNLIKIAENGENFRLEITGRKRRQPNAPGSPSSQFKDHEERFRMVTIRTAEERCSNLRATS
jgi:hypothetical protein